jgi:hypothetical protein
MIMELYGEYQWIPWKFESVPRGFWEDRKNCLKFLKHVEKEMNIISMDSWYFIKLNDIIKHGGSTLLQRYEMSLYRLLDDLYPEYDWKPWKFHTVPQGLWDDGDMICRYMEWMSQEFEIKSPEDWYSMDIRSLMEKGASSLIHKHTNHSNLLSTYYPEYNWQIFKFKNLPRGFFKSKGNVIPLVRWLEDKLHVRDPMEWYDVSLEHLRNVRSCSMLIVDGYSLLIELIRTIYNHIDWKEDGFKVEKKTQKLLFRMMRHLLPYAIVLMDYVHPSMEYSMEHRGNIQLDIFVPSLSLAIEYQGIQHYNNTEKFGSFKEQRDRDIIKRDVCKRCKITWIEIPYWWEFDIER